MAGNTQSQASREAQFELEKWSRQTGAERILRGKWEAGAAGFLGQRFANAYLKEALAHAHKAKESAGRHSHIWKLLETPTSFGELTDHLCYVYDVERERCIQDSLDFIIEFVEKDIIRIVHEKTV